MGKTSFSSSTMTGLCGRRFIGYSLNASLAWKMSSPSAAQDGQSQLLTGILKRKKKKIKRGKKDLFLILFGEFFCAPIWAVSGHWMNREQMVRRSDRCLVYVRRMFTLPQSVIMNLCSTTSVLSDTQHIQNHSVVGADLLRWCVWSESEHGFPENLGVYDLVGQ